jgi:hypothetical protein
MRLRRAFSVFALAAAGQTGIFAAKAQSWELPSDSECGLVSLAMNACDKWGAEEFICRQGIKKFNENPPKSRFWIANCGARKFPLPRDMNALIDKTLTPK